MVGFCGIVGDSRRGIDDVADTVVWSEDEHGVRYRDSGIDLYASFHRSEEANTQPAAAENGRRLWIWGDVLGHEGVGEYEPRSRDGASDADYCAGLLEERGPGFVDGLNSEFAGVVFDDRDGRATLFTDRLGARPIYYTERIDGAVLFSTHPRTVLAHPAIDPTVDEEALVEFLSFERVFGTETPFEELNQLHPGSRLAYDPERDATSRTVYWRPEFDPDDRSDDEFAREFTACFRRAVEERRNRDREEGVLISGGSDSRSLLSILGSDAIGYHMNDERNREAIVAERACEAAGAPFRYLERGPEYYSEVLSRIAGFQLYTSFFDQAHAAGFDEVVREEVGGLFCGQYGNTLLSGHYMPRSTVRIPGLGWTVPTAEPGRIANGTEFVDYLLTNHKVTRGSGTQAPDYLSRGDDIGSVLETRIGIRDGSVLHHGVRYPSLRALEVTNQFYPLTNAPTFLFYYSLVQMVPTHYPFLDNRIVDLALSMPRRYHTKGNVVNRSLELTAPDLAGIPHAETGLPLTYPELAHRASEYASALAGKLGREDDGGSWPDRNAVLRETDLVSRYLLEDDPCWDGIDPEAVRAIYEAHRQGEDRYFDLYALLSLCTTYPFYEPDGRECGE